MDPNDDEQSQDSYIDLQPNSNNDLNQIYNDIN